MPCSAPRALEVQHDRERDAVIGQAAAVREEVVGLLRARRLARVREVIAAADEPGVGGAGVVRVEGRVDVARAFGGL